MPAKQEATPVAEVKAEETKPQIKMEDLLARIVKLEGDYDQTYGAPKDKNPPPAAAEEAKPYEVPGVHEEKDKGDGSEKPKDTKVEGNYDDKYVPPMAKDDEDHDDEEEECTCEKCGSKYKAKKVAEEEEEEKKMGEETLPKKAEFSLNFGKINQVFKPTKEELEAAKGQHVDKNAIFGITKKVNNTIGHQMTAWAISETQRLTSTVGAVSLDVVKRYIENQKHV